MTGRAGEASQRKGNGKAKGNGKGKDTGKAGQAGRHDVPQRHGCRRSQRRVFRRAPSGAQQAPVGRAPEGRAGVQPGMFSRARSFEFHRACFSSQSRQRRSDGCCRRETSQFQSEQQVAESPFTFL